ncbi:MAG: hypothetical protein HQK83_06210, partial [Fibrobacteria bacterium]|nr:hypothetical protein [Fibrobacteria bacterium]
IQGISQPSTIVHSGTFIPVSGIPVSDPRSIVVNINTDRNGTALPGLNVIQNAGESGVLEYQQMWVKPVGLRMDGTVAESNGGCTSASHEETGQTVFPELCLSAIQVFSKEGYTADISIFDHFGKFIHQSVQEFGSCGELLNPARRSAYGLQSWLVWNQRDLAGDFVGTGVYIWKVRFITPNGTEEKSYRQGVVRTGQDPAVNCAAQY